MVSIEGENSAAAFERSVVVTTIRDLMRVCGFLMLIVVACPRASAQSSGPAARGTQPARSACIEEKKESFEIGDDCLKLIETDLAHRLLRTWQYQYQLQEQPSVLVATVNGATSTIPNPNKWLQQHSITITPVELFPRTTNLYQIVQAAYDDFGATAHPAVGLSSDLCPHDPANTIQCLAGGGAYWGHSFWGRMFSGATLTFSVAQRDEVQQGVQAPNLTTSQAWAWNGQLDFDPASLFVTSTNWKNAVSVFGKGPDGVKRAIKSSENSLENKCFLQVPADKTLSECEAEFAKPRLDPSTKGGFWTGLAAVAIPKFQLKALSQFDFIKQGGLLTESPLLQRSLKNISFSWDLRHLVPSTADRVTIAALYEQAKWQKDDSKSEDNSVASKLCLLRSGTTTSYIPVAPDSPVGWCKRLAFDLVSSDYAVGCVKDRSANFGAFVPRDVEILESNIPSPDCNWKTPRSQN